MADKNLHDIKIDEIEGSKKTPIKNILTLLALLFIILVISVVITRLILNTDEGAILENNDSKSELLSNVIDGNKTADIKNEIANSANAIKNAATNTDAEKKDETDTAKAPIANSNITERNLTSAIKAPLTSHEPKVMRTYKEPKNSSTPKKGTTPKEAHNTPKKTVVKHSTVKHTTVKHSSTHPKKEYIDKVVVKKHTKSTSSSKHSSFLGGKRKDVTNSFYIKVGTYRDASTVIRKIKRNHFNYALIKVENDKSLTRVLVGPFISRNQANGQLSKVKANILSGAYVTKAK